MSDSKQVLILTASYDALEALKTFVEQSAPSASVQIVSQIHLALHELCANIIRHAYAGHSGQIELTAERGSGVIQYVVRDTAPRAYVAPPEITAPDPVSLPEGGWGIYIVHQVMNRVEYQRFSDGNEWRLTKDLSAF